MSSTSQLTSFDRCLEGVEPVEVDLAEAGLLEERHDLGRGWAGAAAGRPPCRSGRRSPPPAATGRTAAGPRGRAESGRCRLPTEKLPAGRDVGAAQMAHQLGARGDARRSPSRRRRRAAPARYTAGADRRSARRAATGRPASGCGSRLRSPDACGLRRPSCRPSPSRSAACVGRCRTSMSIGLLPRISAQPLPTSASRITAVEKAGAAVANEVASVDFHRGRTGAPIRKLV